MFSPQISSYQEKKQIEELKTKLKSQQTSYESVMAQITEHDTALAKLRKLYNTANDSVTRLDKGGELIVFSDLDLAFIVGNCGRYSTAGLGCGWVACVANCLRVLAM